ncbi:hypothetical protein CRE_27243 [Caenorhabditis remanei]|uniref:NR LBD domain-containing protein n=1 Tax=Caenorhabditis remanei TaxID=31234 RepID=E3LP89_CAERE|nr:hypothetical protein CRE_27243 [Caenorhabditis remanei]
MHRCWNESACIGIKKGEDESPNYKKLVKVENRNVQNHTITIIKSKENLAKNVVEMLTYLELKLNQLRMLAYNSTFPEYMKSSEELITRGNPFWLADKLGSMKGWPRNEPKNLPKVSRMRCIPDLEPILSDMETFPVIPVANEKMWMFFNMATTIEYAKTFTFFQKLDLKDQTVLIRHVTLICMNLHNSYFAVSQKIQKCMQPDGTEDPQNDEYHFPVFSMSLAPLIRCNIQETEYMLLKAICLCNPTIHGLSEHAQSIISKERQQFSNVLLDYCLRNRRDGPSRFAELIGIIPVLVHQQRLQKDIHIYHIAPIISTFPHVVQFLDDIMHA